MSVARTAVMARRITALIGMLALLGLLAILVWRVYLHHEHASPSDEPAIVCNSVRVA